MDWTQIFGILVMIAIPVIIAAFVYDPPKRIIKEINKRTGEVSYRVERRSYFSQKWETDWFYDEERDMHFDAVFGSINEAYYHIGERGPWEPMQEREV